MRGFDKRSWRWFVIIIAILMKLTQVVHWYNLGGDKSFQVGVALRIAEGHGYTFSVVDPENAPAEKVKHLVLWPPMYSYLVAGGILAGLNPLESGLVLDMLVGIVFIIALYLVLARMGLPFWLLVLIVFFNANAQHDAVYNSSPTDYLSLTFWLLTLLSFERVLREGKAGWSVFFLALIICLPWIRYVNMPLAPVLPLALIYLGYKWRRRYLLKTGIITLILSILSGLALILSNIRLGGQAFYVLPADGGFHFSNWYYFPPMFFHAIGNPHFWSTWLDMKTDFSYGFFRQVFVDTTFILLSVLFIYAIRRRLSGVVYPMMLKSMALISVLNLLLLAWLSIGRSREIAPQSYWTYVEDERYHLLLAILILVFLGIEFMAFIGRKSAPLWKRALGLLLVAIVFGDMLHGFWILRKQKNWKLNDVAGVMKEAKEWAYTDSLRATLPPGKLVITDEVYELRGYALINGLPLLDEPMEFDDNKNGTGRYYMLRVYEGHETLFPWFFRNGHVTCLRRIDGLDYYLRKGP